MSIIPQATSRIVIAGVNAVISNCFHFFKKILLRHLHSYAGGFMLLVQAPEEPIEMDSYSQLDDCVGYSLWLSCVGMQLKKNSMEVGRRINHGNRA